MDWAGRTEGRGNAGKTGDSFFHPSRPSGLGYLIRRKGLILQLKLACEADRMPFHPGNPGLMLDQQGSIGLRSGEERGNSRVRQLASRSASGTTAVLGAARLMERPLSYCNIRHGGAQGTAR